VVVVGVVVGVAVVVLGVVVGVAVVVVVVVAVGVVAVGVAVAIGVAVAVVTQPQHMTALARATETRLARSAVKHALYEGRMTVEEALREECCQSMTVSALLCAQWGWGRARMLRVLRGLSAPVGEMRRIDQLTDRQRAALVEACSARRGCA
jgi:hypothetical protein